MKSINVVFAVHNHQPIGNFDTVFEEAYERSYKPFFEIFERYPAIKLTQHWTGTLLEWLLKKHPDFIERMRTMVHRGQLELLTGSYYEAILAIIPPDDRIGQIRKLTTFIEKTFDYSPRGMWLAERVWEQHLVGSIVDAGVEFLVVDDTHFKHAGLGDDQLLGFYITEDQGKMIKVVPIDKMLRYTVPFRPLEETVHYLQQVVSEHGTRVVVHADDGEKFGVWPKTYTHVYEHGWLESMCRMMEANSAWLRTTHLSAVVDSLPPEGRVYLPTASYSEMLKWVLHPTSFLKLERFENQLKEANLLEENGMFVRGGFWRNFLAKYPEANHMHKKMLRVATRARSAGLKGKNANDVLDHVWAGQCNDPYWHGVFGGLYLPNLRFPVYRNLLQAEARLDHFEKLPLIRVEEVDFDCDGAKEVLVETDEMNLYFKPSIGGTLIELDYKPITFNLLDILSRREEGYHRRLMAHTEFGSNANVHDGVLAKEPGLEQHLHFDWYRHASLVDHFFGQETTPESFAQCKYLELGDFVNQAYTSRTRKSGDHVEVTLERDGALWIGAMPHRVTIRKAVRYSPGSSEFSVDYTIINGEAAPIDVWFGVEFCVGLMAGDTHDRYYKIEGRTLKDKRLRSAGEEVDVKNCTLVDEWLGIETSFMFREPAVLWRHPLETVSLSEAGFERLYQASVVTPHWKFRLEKEHRLRCVQSVRRL